jgi:hypothetical protein
MMNSPQNKNKRKGGTPVSERCLYCGREAGIVWVHGHGQCAACGTNVDECCRGESGCDTSIFPANLFRNSG